MQVSGINITEEGFKQLANQGFNRIPVVLETLSDLDTPLSIYLKLANKPYSYLLESVQGGERFGRYSFIGLAAQTRISVFGNKVSIIYGESVIEQFDNVNPLHIIREYLKRFKTAPLNKLPRFCGGLVGYFGYDVIRYIETRLKEIKPDTLEIPDILLLLSEEIAVVDNLSGKLFLIVYADPRAAQAFQHAQQRLKILLTQLRQIIEIPRESPLSQDLSPLKAGANFQDAVKKAKNYIREGDIMQVVLSSRFQQSYMGSPLALYRALRTLNPSPYMFYFDFQDFHVVGASPEILVRLEKDAVTVRPIAGTRPRGKTLEKDEQLATELLADPKEQAEHIMLVDLGRNDIGRVAEVGSVQVTEKMVVEKYSHVMHIVSNVEGRLKPGLDAIAVLEATFPAGTVSGAPKVRAMEIIDELESEKRGIYAGAVGYISFQNDMDLAIAIRTAIIKDKKLFVQAGAGIVADSIPENEWTEVVNKASAILRAAEMVRSGLDTKFI